VILKFDQFILEKRGPCWKGYKYVGTQKKKGRIVPKCVPEKKCPGCGKDISECSSPDCGSGYYGPEYPNPVYH
jgi:hypothetical protein